jgi:hypothetical protein
MMPPTPPNAERDREEAEFLLGNALLNRIIDEMEHDALNIAVNLYGSMDSKGAEHQMHNALCVREFRDRLQRLLRTRTGRKPVV